MMYSTYHQVEGTIDLTGGWEHVFSTAVDSPILVARAGTLAPGRSYTFTLTASDTFGSMGYAGDVYIRELQSHSLSAQNSHEC